MRPTTIAAEHTRLDPKLGMHRGIPLVDAPMKLVFRRAYYDSLRDLVARAESMEQLEALRGEVRKRIELRQLSRKTVRKIDEAGAAREQYLATRLVLPASAGGVIVRP